MEHVVYTGKLRELSALTEEEEQHYFSTKTDDLIMLKEVPKNLPINRLIAMCIVDGKPCSEHRIRLL